MFRISGNLDKCKCKKTSNEYRQTHPNTQCCILLEIRPLLYILFPTKQKIYIHYQLVYLPKIDSSISTAKLSPTSMKLWHDWNIFSTITSLIKKMASILPTGQWYAPSAVIAWYCIVLHSIAWYCMVMHGIAWYCMVLHGIAWYCMVLHGIAWYCMALHGIAWYCMVLHGIAW